MNIQQLRELGASGTEEDFLEAAVAVLEQSTLEELDEGQADWLQERLQHCLGQISDWPLLTLATIARAHLMRHRNNPREAFFLFHNAIFYAQKTLMKKEHRSALFWAVQMQKLAFEPYASLQEHLGEYEHFVRALLQHHIDVQREAGRYTTKGTMAGVRLSHEELGNFFERPTPNLEIVSLERLKRQNLSLQIRDAISQKNMSIPLAEIACHFSLNRTDSLILMVFAVAYRQRSVNRVLRHAMNDLGADAPFPAFFQELLGPVLQPDDPVIDRFESDAPLMKWRFVYPYRHSDLPPKLSRPLVADEAVLARLYGVEGMPDALHGIASPIPSKTSVIFSDLARQVAQEMKHGSHHQGVALLTGGWGSGCRTVAGVAAEELGHQGLMLVRLHAIRMLASMDQRIVLTMAMREACMRNLALCLEGRAEESLSHPQIQDLLLDAVSHSLVPCFFLSNGPYPPVFRMAFFDVQERFVSELAPAQKQQMWQEMQDIWEADTDQATDSFLQTLALGPGGLLRLYGTALSAARARNHQSPQIHLDDLKRSAVDEIDSGLAGIATRLRLTLDWSDIILPEETLIELNEIISFARYRDTVMYEWGFERKLPYGKALSALFYGPPGTGKTMMAMIMAKDLGMEVFQVDLSQIISKYIGETEKNLKRVFDQAADGRAIILFEEADSLFSKRTSVSSSHDRHSNVEINYLLQKMESFEGVTILTSNNFDNIDEAFKRRIRFKIKFPMPSVAEREALWGVMFPPQALLDLDIDYGELARKFEFAPAYIKNSVIRAAFKAAELGCNISQKLLEDAARAESRQLGLLIRDS